MNQWSRKDAEARFDEVFTAARHQPQMVTEAGKPAFIVVDAGEFERLTGEKPASPKTTMYKGREMTFAELLLAMPTKEGFDFDRRNPKRDDIDF